MWPYKKVCCHQKLVPAWLDFFYQGNPQKLENNQARYLSIQSFVLKEIFESESPFVRQAYSLTSTLPIHPMKYRIHGSEVEGQKAQDDADVGGLKIMIWGNKINSLQNSNLSDLPNFHSPPVSPSVHLSSFVLNCLWLEYLKL